MILQIQFLCDVRNLHIGTYSCGLYVSSIGCIRVIHCICITILTYFELHFVSVYDIKIDNITIIILYYIIYLMEPESATMKEKTWLIESLVNSYELYFKHGSRSSKKVDYFHGQIKTKLEELFKTENNYKVCLEHNVKSMNSASKKKCDIVILKNGEPYIIFPVKMIMTNYKQNKNNSYENLTGELCHLTWAHTNPDNPLHIIPINIYMNKTPYLDCKKKIVKYEKLTYNDIEIYDLLKKKHLCYDMINYILEVEQTNEIGDEFANLPKIMDTIAETPYRSFSTIIQELL